MIMADFAHVEEFHTGCPSCPNRPKQHCVFISICFMGLLCFYSASFIRHKRSHFFCKISVSALTSYASICPLWMRLAILLKIFATWQKTRFVGEQSSVVVMELHCGEVVMRTVTLCHQLSPQCIPWRRDLAHHSKMFLNQRWIQMQLQIWKYKQKCHNERPGASLEDVPPSKSKALCILQQCCTPRKSRSSYHQQFGQKTTQQ